MENVKTNLVPKGIVAFGRVLSKEVYESKVKGEDGKETGKLKKQAKYKVLIGENMSYRDLTLEELFGQDNITCEVNDIVMLTQTQSTFDGKTVIRYSDIKKYN